MTLDVRELTESLNRNCHCITVDPAALQQGLENGPTTAGIYRSILRERPHLFSASPVFLAREQLERMRAVIAAVESVVALASFVERALGGAPPAARIDQGCRGNLLGYDFHLGADGPQLIEINTNAGGALLNAALARAQRACCTEVDAVLADSRGQADPEARILAMFVREWTAARGARPLMRVAIVDFEPSEQYLHPEFLMYQQLFERAGIRAVIADPRELEFDGKQLLHGDAPIDLVYNRLTDFLFEEESSAALAHAHAADAVVVTPDPRSYALYADKGHLVTLSDAQTLQELGCAAAEREIQAATVPTTVLVGAENAERLWAERREWFFKPLRGFGSKAAYRGAKLTRKVWAQILARPYVAQRLVPPSERTILVGETIAPLKLDLRCYTHGGHVELFAARLYAGQTTNFRTAGGGFAPVFTERLAR